MARGGVARSNMLLLLRRSSSSSSAAAAESRSGVSKLVGTDEVGAKNISRKVVDSSSSSSSSCYWVPHPRTGIYFPVGHDWVMEDVPVGAATFTQTCWFRN